jgi:hypothetical protein
MKSRNSPSTIIKPEDKMIWYYVIYQEYDKCNEAYGIIINPFPDLASATKHVELHPDAQVIKGVRLDVIQKHLEIIDSDKVTI